MAAEDGYIKDDSTLEIGIETNDQEMRYFFQQIVIDFVKVSMLGTRPVVGGSALRIPPRRPYRQSRGIE